MAALITFVGLAASPRSRAGGGLKRLHGAGRQDLSQRFPPLTSGGRIETLLSSLNGSHRGASPRSRAGGGLKRVRTCFVSWSGDSFPPLTSGGRIETYYDDCKVMTNLRFPPLTSGGRIETNFGWSLPTVGRWLPPAHERGAD